MPVTHDDAANTLDSVTGINGVQHGGTGANLSATGPGILQQATLGAAVTVSTAGTTLIADDAVTNAKLRDSSALSVIGRSANSSGDPADIAAANNGDVLRLRNGALTWARDVFNVQDYGATGDGSTDDYTAIAACVTAALASSHEAPTIYFPPCAGYASSSLVSILMAAGGALSVIMDAPLIYTGSAQTGAFLTVGITGASKTTTGSRFKLWVQRATQSDWSDASHAGMRLVNFNQCDVYVVASDYFTTGVRFEGAGDGFAYNTITLGRLLNCKYGLDFTHTTVSATDGWCNGNTLFGGRFQYNLTGGASDTTDRYAARFRSESGRTTSPNHIVWYHPIVELGKSGDSYATGHAFLFERGSNNNIYDASIEGAKEYAIFRNDVYANKVHLAYSNAVTNTKDDRSTNAGNVVIGPTREHAREASRLIYACDDILSKATPYDGTKIALHGVGKLASGGGIVRVATKGATAIDFGSDHLSIGSTAALGVKVTTNNNKVFLAAAATTGAGSPRLIVQAYDSDAAVITSSGAWAATTAYVLKNRVTPTTATGLWYRCTTAGTTGGSEPTWPTTIGGTVTDGSAVWTCEGPAPVRGQNGVALSYISDLGGIWRTTPGFSEGHIELSDAVTSAFIGWTAGSSNMQIRGMKLYAPPANSNVPTPTVTLGYSGGQEWTRRTATQSPQTSAFGGPFLRGDVVWNDAATVGQPIGWMCTAAGSPGTWVALANL